MTTATTGPPIVPRRPAAAPARRAGRRGRGRPGRGRRLGVRPLRQHQARLRRPVAFVQRLVRRDGPALPAGGSPQPRARGCGVETPAQAAERARFDLALVAVLSDGGCGAVSLC